MADYFLAPSLARLRTRCNTLWPERDTKSDGWIGDASHAARKSDHNPDWSAPGARRGIVRAMDIDEDGIDSKRLLVEAIGHPAVEYVIYERRIYSRVRDFAPKVYDGLNAHEHHLHISIRHTVAAEMWAGVWLPDQEDDVTPEDHEKIKAAIQAEVKYHYDRTVDRFEFVVGQIAELGEKLAARQTDAGLFVRKVGTSPVYRAFAAPDGWVLTHVTAEQYVALGRPLVTDLPAGDAIFKGRVLVDQSTA